MSVQEQMEPGSEEFETEFGVTRGDRLKVMALCSIAISLRKITKALEGGPDALPSGTKAIPDKA